MQRKKIKALNSLVDAYFIKRGWTFKLYELKIRNEWANIVGVTISNYTTKIYMSKRVLYVSLNSPAARQNLMMVRTNLVEKINNYLDANIINDIKIC